MSQWTLYALSGVVVLAVALYGLFSSEDLVRKVIAANLVGSGVFLFLVALARRASGGIPDPVPHALVLTGIVVSVSATALALALARRLGGAADDTRPSGSIERETDEP
ncbi:cation:proton antiporter subunit C [Sorangium sp. So ce887]|uniref:cation:proton antiporter subunit C n=1 Tax=Sorangium sp. So ce887 TaxID=3133324 RepID=UPI003F5FF230